MTSAALLECMCFRCSGIRRHVVLFRHEKSRDEFEHELVECEGCGHLSYRRTLLVTSEKGVDQVAHEQLYPEFESPKRLPMDMEFCSAVPSKIEDLYNETISCLNAGCRILVVAGLRALVEAICLNDGLTKGNLNAKINLLHGKARITEHQAQALHEVRYFGNAALHEISEPDEEELRLGIEVIESVIKHLFIDPVRTKRLKQKRTSVWDDENEGFKQ